MKSVGISTVKATVSKSAKLTKEDVWGKWDENTNKRVSDGMIVSRSDETCSIFGDIVPYKSVTVICNEEQFNDVKYWLGYVQGGGCISKTKKLDNNKLAIRSDYQCW